MRPYTEIPGFSDVVLEESYVLAIRATPGLLTMDVDIVLTTDHPAYAPPPSDRTECFRRGRITFEGVRRLTWEDQGARPAVDATGEVDFGHIDALQ